MASVGSKLPKELNYNKVYAARFEPMEK